MQKILINGITLEQANLVGLVNKIQYWQKHNCHITVIGNQQLKQALIKHHLGLDFIILKNTKTPKTIFQFIIEGGKRNLFSLFLLNKIKKQNFSHIYCISSVLDLTILPFFLKIIQPSIKWITVFDNTVTTKSAPLLACIFYQISLILLKRCDYIFASTLPLKKYLINLRFVKNKITITGYGIENELINKITRPKNPKFDAIFVGRINPAKGIYDLLKILKIIKKKYPLFMLAIMGRGDETNEELFKTKIKQLGLKSNIIIIGFKTGSEKFTIIKNSKIFMFPSYAESFGIALLEAVCCGLPCFAYDLPIYKTIYKNNEINLSPLKNSRNMAYKVLKVFSANQFYNLKGQKLLNRYSWDKIAQSELTQIRKLTC